MQQTMSSNVSRALAGNRLGVPAVVFFVLSAAAPLTVVAGGVPIGYAVTGGTGIPLAFLAVGAVLAVFSVGYVAMAKYVANAGAFYAYIARGLGRPVGVGAAWVALLAYNAVQVALYGAFGAVTAAQLGPWLGVEPPWWSVALAAWALVGILGVLRVEVNGTVLAFLLVAEIAVTAVFTVANLMNPADGRVDLATLSPDALFGPGAGALLVIAVLGFVGFESAVVFSEESKHPRRTVPMATYVSVALIGVLYATSAWAMTVATGPDRIVDASRTEGTELLFNLAATHLGTAFSDLGHLLFITSLVAAMISFHNTTARYAFALGRERVLPAAFGRTSRRSGAPKVGSLAQSVVGLAVIVLYAAAGWDPLVQLFFWAGTGGGFGVLLLVTTTSVAVLGFFSRSPVPLGPWRRVVRAQPGHPRPARHPGAGPDQLRDPARCAAGHPAALVHPRCVPLLRRAGHLLGDQPAHQPPAGVRRDRAGRQERDGDPDRPRCRGARRVPRRVPWRGDGMTARGIVQATMSDARLAADIIAEAFQSLEVAAWLVPDPAPRPHVLAGNFRIFVDHALIHGTIDLTEDRTGVAVWFPRLSPVPVPPVDYHRRQALVCAEWTDRFRTLDELFDANHPQEPHYHLAFLAVRPARQGTGLGSALLHHRHRHLDQYALPAYLEASSPRSRDFYTRHGYRAGLPFALPGGPSLWPMWRMPR